VLAALPVELEPGGAAAEEAAALETPCLNALVEWKV
jgi:hypothetical protein